MNTILPNLASLDAALATAPNALPSIWQSILAKDNLRAACRRVVANHGAPGVDQMPVEALEAHLRQNWPALRTALLSGAYQPQPARQVNIPKPGGRGVRQLRIPTVVDRFLQNALLQVLQPMFEPGFSEFSFAYRPGRTAHGAVAAAQTCLEQGFTYVVDLDLVNFFDRVNHDILLAQIRRRLDDERVLNLIRNWLQAGAIHGRLTLDTPEGTPQGGPLSPLLANITLDDFDKELECHAIPFVRYADDCLVFAASHAEAQRRLEHVSTFLTTRLGLQLNLAKTRVCRAHEVSFLSFSFGVDDAGRTRRDIAPEAVQGFAEKITELTAVRNGISPERKLQELAAFYAAWSRYFSFAQAPGALTHARGQVRLAFRSWLWRHWATPERRAQELIRRGIRPDLARQAAVRNVAPEQAAQTMPLSQAVPNRFFDQCGLGEAPASPTSAKPPALPYLSPPSRSPAPPRSAAPPASAPATQSAVPSGPAPAADLAVFRLGVGPLHCELRLRLPRWRRPRLVWDAPAGVRSNG